MEGMSTKNLKLPNVTSGADLEYGKGVRQGARGTEIPTAMGSGKKPRWEVCVTKSAQVGDRMQMDEVMFSQNGANGPELKTTSVFDLVRQVPAPWRSLPSLTVPCSDCIVYFCGALIMETHLLTSRRQLTLAHIHM